MRKMIAAVMMLLAVEYAAAGELRIVAATNDLAAMASAVGGDLVHVDVVARPDRNLHTVEVRPSTMRKAGKADIYLSVGLSLDLWSADIVRGSRNRHLKVVDCSQGINPLEVPQGKVDASQGDVHPQGNPHYWLDPDNGILVARLLAREFSSVDPEHGGAYEGNAEAFAQTVESMLPAWEAKLRGKSFVEYHRSWIYLATRFDMTIVSRVEPLPGIPPTARHLTELSGVIKRTQVPVVVREPFHSESPLEFLERETGIRSVVLSSVCQEPTPESYLAHFDEIASALGSGSGMSSGREVQ